MHKPDGRMLSGFAYSIKQNPTFISTHEIMRHIE